MKTKSTASLLLLPFAALFPLAPAVFADTTDATDTAVEPAFAPKAYPLSRYDHLDKKSPFEFEPVKEAAATVTDPFAEVSLAGYCGSGNSMTVYLITGKEKKRISVYGDGSPHRKRDDSGYRVIGIKRGRTLKTTAVILEKDGVQKDVMFESETLHPKGGAGPGQPQQPQQMVPGPNGQMVPRPIIPKPGGSMNQPQQPYVAPQAFIPGHGNQPQQVQPPQVPQPGALTGQNVGNMTNQQLVNALTGPGGQPAATPGVVQPQATGGGERGPGQPSRRRVVLPTQQ